MAIKGHRYGFIQVGLILIGAFVCAAFARAQSVSHPASDITTTIKRYSYTYMLSQTTKKELEYIIVRSASGEIKTVFNACDVCYPFHKGYSQNGSELVCNNCGNRFAIANLGAKTTGTCNPGYLPHTLQGNDIIIQVSDLIAGAYYFAIQTVSGVADAPAPETIQVTTLDHRNVTVTFPGEGRREFRVFSMDGKCRSVFSSDARQVRLNTDELSAGAYLLAVRDGAVVTTKKFLVY